MVSKQTSTLYFIARIKTFHFASAENTFIIHIYNMYNITGKLKF